ncbi:hypothetical protein NDU88_011118 [Pleurodeles waltl]|uniref:Uncharacterized protein n=1 Tax=Pleurodeles waltl TaxID=8319 RepID=A0AAV7PZS0_PLEWA|nr:hypothetical protein NDU88_011118 [Pleurodeles waltl]
MVHRSHRCMGLTSVEHYAMALHLSQLAYMLLEVTDPPQWDIMECILLSSRGRLGALYKTGPLQSGPDNPILRAMHAAWRRTHGLVDTHPSFHIWALCKCRCATGEIVRRAHAKPSALVLNVLLLCKCVSGDAMLQVLRKWHPAQACYRYGTGDVHCGCVTRHDSVTVYYCPVLGAISAITLQVYYRRRPLEMCLLQLILCS